MGMYRDCLSVFVGLTLSAAALLAAIAGPAAASAAVQGKEQAYKAVFECSISLPGNTCSVAVDQEIPAGSRLRVEAIEARVVVPVTRPSAAATPPDLYVEFGDPSADGGVRTLHTVPKLTGRTEGGFYSIYVVSEKVEAFAYRTGTHRAPKVYLVNPSVDSLKLQNGRIQDGVIRGQLVPMQ